MTVLLLGYTEYVQDLDLTAVFQGKQVLVQGEWKSAKKGIKLLRPSKGKDLQRILDVYDVAEVVYLSSYLTSQGQKAGELEELREVLEVLGTHFTGRFLYLTGPDLGFNQSSQRQIFMSALEGLVQNYSERTDFSAKIIRSLYMFEVSDFEGYLASKQSNSENGLTELAIHPLQEAFVIAPKDLFVLVYRVLEEWDTCPVLLVMPSVSLLLVSNLALELATAKPDQFKGDVVVTLRGQEQETLERLHWSPQVNILEFATAQKSKQSKVGRKVDKKGIFAKIEGLGRREKGWLGLVQVLLAFGVVELLTELLANQIYLRAIDYRLFFVMIVGLFLGTNFGFLAAALAGLGLLWETMRSGIDFLIIFYEPSNWAPYIMYFIAAMLIGVFKDRKREQIDYLTAENESLEAQLVDERQYADALLVDKSALSHQILRHSNSFGLVSHFTSQLNTIHEDFFLITLLEEISEQFGTRDVVILPSQANSVLSLTAYPDKRSLLGSLELKEMELPLLQIDESNLWVNTRLKEKEPMLMGVIKTSQGPAYYGLIQSLPMDKMSLSYQNLFRSLLDLASQSYGWLSYYQRTSLNHANTVLLGGRSVMDNHTFLEKLQLASKVTSHYFEVLALSVQNTEILEPVFSKLSVFESLAQVGNHFYLMTGYFSPYSLEELKQVLSRVQVDVTKVYTVEEMIEELQALALLED